MPWIQPIGLLLLGCCRAPNVPELLRDTVEAPGALLHVRTAGTGPEIVLLPSLGRGSKDFARLASDLVAADFRVARPAQPRGIPPSLAIQEPASCTTWRATSRT